jgi:hypothetical protein
VSGGRKFVPAGNPHDGGKQAQCVRSASIGQTAAFHLVRQYLGLRGNRGGRAMQGGARQGNLKIVREVIPICKYGGKHDRGLLIAGASSNVRRVA